MLKPSPLPPGGTVGIAAPSGPVDEVSIHKAAQFLTQRGYRVKLAAHLFEAHGYLAGTDKDRASDMNAMFADPAVDAILLARGGFGSARLLDLIDYNLVSQNPKPLIGYSDSTALQLALLARCNLVSFYGPVASIDLAGRSASLVFGRMLRALEASPGARLFSETPPSSIEALSTGQCTGRLVGGCLSVVVSLLGSDYFPDTRGAILFLEDVDEPPYRIDRYLMQLELAGVLSHVAGVLLGRFVRCYPRGGRPSLSLGDVFRERFAGRPYPVLSGLPFGHIARKTTVPQGVMCVLDTSRWRIEYASSCCNMNERAK